MTEAAAMWAVVWQVGAQRYVLDVDALEDAGRIAVALAESGRQHVQVLRIEVGDGAIDEETAQRIWRRIEARLRAQHAGGGGP